MKWILLKIPVFSLCVFASLRETQNPCQQCRAANRLLLAIPLRGFAGLDARLSDFLSWFFGWRTVKGF